MIFSEGRAITTDPQTVSRFGASHGSISLERVGQLQPIRKLLAVLALATVLFLTHSSASSTSKTNTRPSDIRNVAASITS